MNAFQDLTKKTSITSLLNPQEFAPHLGGLGQAPLVPNHAQSHGHPPYYGPEPFPLRAANWSTANDPHQRKAVVGLPTHDHHRSYQETTNAHVEHHHPSHSYAYNQPPRMVRQRVDERLAYGGEGAGWPTPAQQRHDPSAMPYGAPVIAPMYSDERTALSGDYPTQLQSSYSSAYEQHSGNMDHLLWQTTERASLRLAARGTSRPLTEGDRSVSPYYRPYDPLEYSRQPQQIAVPPPQAESLSHSASKPSSSSKRTLPEGDATLAPKPKRPKAKAKATGSESPSISTAAPSRRGYNAKKRSEAAFISAQNDAMQKAQRDLSNTPAGGSNSPQADRAVTFIPELQFARCMSNRYKFEQFPRCVSCTRRWAGDTCRFQGIRYFMRDPDRNLLGISFCESHSVSPMPSMAFPTTWNRKVEKEHVRRSKLSIAKALLPTLMLEQEHLKVEEIVRRPRESEVRVTCDTCMTSLFSTSFMCRLCGREVCNECFQQVRELTEAPQNATAAEMTAFTTRRDKHAHANPFFLSCLKRNEHSASDFTPVTRFVGAELVRTIQEMQEILQKESTSENECVSLESNMDTSADGAPSTLGFNANYDLSQSQATPNGGVQAPASFQPQPAPEVRPEPPAPSTGITYTAYDASQGFPDPLLCPVYDDYIPSNAPEHVTSIPTYPLQIIPADLYDPPKLSSSSSRTPSPVFASLWRLGLPLLVKGVLTRFKIQWNPQYFMDRYGDQSCLIIECQTELNKRVNVAQFFGQFGQYKDRTECWKLKDWPPTAEFKSTFPELFEDFSNAVPVPDYVRRDGVFNIGSHFPSNAVGPDLGPKMYNALASSQEVGSKGSTRLHMDMADALNVMLYSSMCEDGSEGYAVWDLFRAEDSDKIRAFLRKRFGFGLGPPSSSASTSALSTSAAQATGGSNGQTVADVVVVEGGKGASAGNSKGVPTTTKAPMHARHDPIHGQQFYLDVELRKALWEEHGVKSYRVYQRPGDGVFIPAGCAHQVANMADCIKIATDFVSPENIDRCEKLTKEFREQNQSKVWKEDVLQLRTMMWFAWQSCSILEKEIEKEKEKEKEKEAAT